MQGNKKIRRRNKSGSSFDKKRCAGVPEIYEKEGEITEDDLKDLEKEVQNLTDKFCKNIDNLVSEKEKEIMSL